MGQPLFDRIRKIFKVDRSVKKEKRAIKSDIMRLNSFLLHAAMKHMSQGGSKKARSLFTTKILSSKNRHLSALVKQAEAACVHQDLELFFYKQFFCRNGLALRRVIQWKFSKYIKTRQEANALLNAMKETSPETFKRHLVTLLSEEKLSSEEITKEVEHLENQWKLWTQQGSTESLKVQ